MIARVTTSSSSRWIRDPKIHQMSLDKLVKKRRPKSMAALAIQSSLEIRREVLLIHEYLTFDQIRFVIYICFII
jgi:hypothetical protein